MRKKHKTSLIAFIGLLTLFAASQVIEPSEKQIQEINRGLIGEKITVSGTITSIDKYGSIEFIEITGITGVVEGISFSRTNLSRGDNVQIYGTISMYQGDLNLQIEKYEKVSSLRQTSRKQ